MEFPLQKGVNFLRMRVKLSWIQCTKNLKIRNGKYPNTAQQGTALLEHYVVCHHSSSISFTDQSRSRESTLPEVALTGRCLYTLQPPRDRVTMPWVELIITPQTMNGNVYEVTRMSTTRQSGSVFLLLFQETSIHLATFSRRNQRQSGVLEAALALTRTARKTHLRFVFPHQSSCSRPLLRLIHPR